jgi:hypothetical protein
MKITLLAAAIVLLLSTQQAYSVEPKPSELEAAAKKGLEIDPSYEERAIPVYFGPQAQFMQKCAPPGTPIAKPFVIYISVSPSGEIERQVSVPGSPIAECMISATRKRLLPQPQAPLILKLEMNFTE